MRIPDTCIIELSGMEFHAFHGCLEQERAEGNLFKVDLKIEAPLRKAAKSDILSDTVDYGAIYKVVLAEMEKPSNLLEHVAWRIAEAVYRSFDICAIVVKVSKHNPPVGGNCEWSSVTVSYPTEIDLMNNPR